MMSAAQVVSESRQTEMFRLAAYEPATFGCAGDLLSPSQVRTFMDCQARWFFKYVERLPDPQTSSLALGKAVHAAIAENFAQKIETKEDLELTGVLAIYRQAWLVEAERTVVLEKLVEMLYALNCRQVLQRHGWRCARCHSGTKLQIHHRHYRSHEECTRSKT